MLVVIVDPPRQGDPIHTLQKGMQRRQPGAIFIRHPGKTEQADPHDIERLTARSHPHEARLDISINAAAGQIEAVADPHAHFRAWAETERVALLHARYETPSARYPGFAINTMLGILDEPDPRTEEEYAEDVDTYVKESEAVLAIRAVRRQALRTQTMLALEVDNPGDDSVAGLLVEAHVLGATGYSDQFLHETEDHLEPNLPARPVALGTPRQRAGLEAMLAASSGWDFSRSFVPPIRRHRPGRGWKAHGRDDMIHILYDPIDLRPDTKMMLPVVPVRVPNDGRLKVRVVWTAASTNLKGRLEGAFDLSVVPAAFDLSSVFRDERRTADETESASLSDHRSTS